MNHRLPSHPGPAAGAKPSPPSKRSIRKQAVTRREILSATAGASVAGGVGLFAWKSGIGSVLGGRSPVTSTPPAASTLPLSTPPAASGIVIDPTPTPFTTPTPEPGSPPSDMVKETSIRELRMAYDKGWFSVSEYAEATIDRIESMDTWGPSLRAVIELNPDAMDIAEQLDREAREGRIRGPLHGVPVLVKDVFATADRMRTTAGSLALGENEAIRDAFLIRRLRDAGAIILGKTNLSEFSNFRGGLPSGWSSRGGQTVNPYVLTHSAWGSSTGSAVAAAASYAPFTIGVETDGSIICPASACGVVGLKPTVGLVSRRGGIPISFTQDSPGPIGRTVEDVAWALSAMAGYDREDMAFGRFADTSPAAAFDRTPVPEPGMKDYTRVLDRDGLRGARIGVCRSMFGFDLRADAHVENALDAMREAGAEVIDDIYMDAAGILRDSGTEGNVLLVEFAWGFQHFLDTYMPEGPIRSLQDVVDYNYAHWEETLSAGGQEGLEAALSAGSINDAWYQELVREHVTTAREQGIDLTMDMYKLDALVAPSAPIPNSLMAENFSGSSTQVPSMAGYPSLTLPIGYSSELPAGLHMFGRAFSEGTLLRLAYSLEQTLQARMVPEYLDEAPWSTEDDWSTPGEDLWPEEEAWPLEGDPSEPVEDIEG